MSIMTGLTNERNAYIYICFVLFLFLFSQKIPFRSLWDNQWNGEENIVIVNTINVQN